MAIWSEGGQAKTVYCVVGQVESGRYVQELVSAPDVRSYSYWHFDTAPPERSLGHARYVRLVHDLSDSDAVLQLGQRLPVPPPTGSPVSLRDPRKPFHYDIGAVSVQAGDRTWTWDYDEFAHEVARADASSGEWFVYSVLRPALGALLKAAVERPAETAGAAGKAILERVLASSSQERARALATRALPVFGVEAWRPALADVSPHVRAAAVLGLFTSVQSRDARLRLLMRSLEVETHDRVRVVIIQAFRTLAPLDAGVIDQLVGLLTAEPTESNACMASFCAEHGERRGIEWLRRTLKEHGASTPDAVLAWAENCVRMPETGVRAETTWAGLLDLLDQPDLAWNPRSRLFQVGP